MRVTNLGYFGLIDPSDVSSRCGVSLGSWDEQLLKDLLAIAGS